LEYLTSGITAIFDMYMTPDTVAKACKDMGMRCVLSSGLNNFVSTIVQTEKEYNELNYYDELISYKLGCHAEYTCDLELLKELTNLSHKYNAPIYAHMSETQKEVEECINKYGLSPVALFDSLGLFDFGGGIYHGVYLSEEDRRIIKNRNVSIITNPASNAKLASGIAPIKTYLADGITIAIGTDGPSSNNCLDMFREMFLVAGLNNLLEKDAGAVSAKDILEMATVKGAKTMELNDADVLAQGKLADIIMIDLNQPNMQPIHNIENNLVFSGSKLNVKMTMINGQILYEDYHFYVVQEPEDIYDICMQIVNRLIHS
jgi:5-methylthioadenosine/S-adenosylhomocysteine deaminase